MKADILLVEDDEFVSAAIVHHLSHRGYRVHVVSDCQSAWATLQDGTDYEAALLDRQLADMDGLELLRQIKGDARFRHLPVVMETSMGDSRHIREGLESGAYYYLIKPLNPDQLIAVVDAAVDNIRAHRQMAISDVEYGISLGLLEEGTFRFRTLDDARLLARSLARAYPDPQRVAMGLQELLLNAVEHGNLAIDYEEKTKLLLEDTWQEEIERRLSDRNFRHRQATAELKRQAGDITITIRDEGEGFDWEQYLSLSPERALDPHGRGIALARMTSFDSIEYQGKGNIVQAKVFSPK